MRATIQKVLTGSMIAGSAMKVAAMKSEKAMTNLPSTPSREVALLPVIQTDRDAAADYIEHPGASLYARQGKADNSKIIQAFAAYRARLQPQDTAASALRKALRRVATNSRFDWLGRDDCNAVRTTLTATSGTKEEG